MARALELLGLGACLTASIMDCVVMGYPQIGVLDCIQVFLAIGTTFLHIGCSRKGSIFATHFNKMLAPDSPDNRGRKMSNFFRAFRENVELQQVTLSQIQSLYHQSHIPKIQTIKTTVTGAPCSLPVAALGLHRH